MSQCGIHGAKEIVLLVHAVFLCLTVLNAAGGQEQGSAAAQLRREAASAIPYRALRPDLAREIRQIVSHPSIYRRLPVCAVDCDPEMFTFLVRHPEVVTSIWQQMGVTELSLARLGPYAFRSTDGMGTTCTFQLVCGSPQLHLYYGNGFYEGQLLKHRISGRSVMLLRTSQRTADAGSPVMVNTLDVFVTLDNEAVDLAAKTVSPLFVKAADENFVTTAKFLGQLSRAARGNTERMHVLANRLTGIDPSVRSQFISVINRAAAQTQPSPVASAAYLQTQASKY